MRYIYICICVYITCIYKVNVYMYIFVYMCDELGYPHALRNLHVYASNANNHA